MLTAASSSSSSVAQPTAEAGEGVHAEPSQREDAVDSAVDFSTDASASADDSSVSIPVNVTQVERFTESDDQPVSGQQGQDPPSSLPQPPTPSSLLTPAVQVQAEDSPIASPEQSGVSASTSSNAPRESETVKEKGKTSLLSLSIRSRSRRKEASEGMHSVSSTSGRLSSLRSAGGATSTVPKTKVSIVSRITRIFTSCMHPSNRAHDIDVEEGAPPVEDNQEEKEAVEEETKTLQQVPEESTSTTVKLPPSLRPIDTTAPQDPEVIVPPTPTKSLLPLDETDGLTSGAVQPPGSTGELAHEHDRSHSADSSEESDGSFTEEDAFGRIIRADEEDEEQRLIKNGGNGIPIDADGTLRPLLPPIAPEYVGRKCLVLDLDETLVHSSLKMVPSPDYIVPVEIESYWHSFYVLKRPGVDAFLKQMGELYEVVVFTASLSKYADPVLDRLDPDHTVAHRLFRESCYNHRGNYVKDLSQLGRPVADTIILDNSPASYIFHPHNAVPVSSWFNDPHDTELTDLCPFLADLVTVGDVRQILNPAL